MALAPSPGLSVQQSGVPNGWERPEARQCSSTRMLPTPAVDPTGYPAVLGDLLVKPLYGYYSL